PYRVAAVLVGIAVALLAGPALAHGSASSFYSQVWSATFGSTSGLSALLLVAAPLLLTSLGAAVPYRLKLWNIGGDGQMYIGAFAAGLVVFSLSSHLPGSLVIVCALLASLVGGLLWIAIPAIARALIGVNEILTTLMMNFVGLYWLTYVV